MIFKLAAIKEPMAWHGPIVMNTHEDLYKDSEELQNENDKFFKVHDEKRGKWA